MVSLFKGYNAGYKGLIPPYIVLTQPQGRFSEAGFLGGRYKPFATGGDPAQTRFAVEGVVAPGITDQRQQRRRELLHKLEHPGARHAERSAVGCRRAECEKQAYDLILGDAGKVFDLSQEKDDLRDRYGRTHLRPVLPGGAAAGRARRALHHHQLQGGWDTHKDNFQTMNRQTAANWTRGWRRCCEDLSDHGLLESTIVWWCGEFGRTPKVALGGALERRPQSLWQGLLGAGGRRRIQGRPRRRRLDAERGEEVKERPVYPWTSSAACTNCWASIPKPSCRIPRRQFAAVLPTAEEGTKMGGRLKEIM